jgi:hypothetical protein
LPRSASSVRLLQFHRLDAELHHVEAHLQPALDDPKLDDLALELRGSSVANIAAGFGRATLPQARRRPDPPPGIAPAAPGSAKPGIGIPRGFHIFCMNSATS